MFADRSSIYVIAEVGSNHGGRLDVALSLIEAAAGVGADAAKFQAGHADHVYDRAQFPDEHASFKKYAEPVLEWLPKLAERARDRGIDFGCSAFCLDSLDAVDPFVKWHKVASIESRWTEYVHAVRSKRKPYLISNGAHDRIDSMDALATVLHCVTAYPADLADLHLRSHPRSRCWGLSDHTIHPTIAACAAVALGAKVVEKHMRLDTASLRTPDSAHSIDQHQFREMVQAIRLTEKALGSSEKRIRESEEPYLKYRRGPRALRGA